MGNKATFSLLRAAFSTSEFGFLVAPEVPCAVEVSLLPPLL
jgi:hypothetical protein